MCNSCIQKNDKSTLTRLDGMLSSVESDVCTLFIQYLARVKSTAMQELLTTRIEQGRLDLVINILDSQFVGFEKLVSNRLADSAEFEIGVFSTTLLGLYAFNYKPTDYRAIALNEELQRSLQYQIVNSQQEILRQVLFDSFGLTSKEVAKNIADNLGLTNRQYQAIKNYEQLLRNKSTEALRRTLRDTKFDERFKSDRPLTENQIKRMVSAYRENMLVSRANTIARTEAGRIVNEGRRLGILQVLGFMQMPQGNIIKTWRSMGDKHVRFTHSHSGLDGQIVLGMNNPFQSPSGALIRYPHDPQAPSSETISCRCYVLYAYLNQEE